MEGFQWAMTPIRPPRFYAQSTTGSGLKGGHVREPMGYDYLQLFGISFTDTHIYLHLY